MNIQKITVAAFCTAITAVLAQVTIPLPFSPVPFTGQLIGLLLSALLLGPRLGFAAALAYILLGAVGAPVFSFGTGGLAVLTGPTGGYLWGFLPATFAAGLLSKKMQARNFILSILALLPALLIIYFFGALQLALFMRYNIKQALVTGVLPFIPFDLVKVFLAVYFSEKIKKSLRQNGLAHLLEN